MASKTYLSARRKAPPRPGERRSASPDVQGDEDRQGRSTGSQVIHAELVDESLVAVTPHAPLSAMSVLSTWLASKHGETIRKYQGDLGDFSSWYMVEVLGAPWDPEQLGLSVPLELIGSTLSAFLLSPRGNALDAALRYRAWLEGPRKLAPNTINRKLSALRSYTKLARQVDVCPWDLTIEGVESVRVRDVRGPGPEGYRDLVDGALAKVEQATIAGDDRSRKCWVRNVALVRLYHDAGLRRFEPLTIDLPEDVDFQNERLRFRRKHRPVKEWFDIGSTRAIKAVQDWILERGDEPGPLFVSFHNGRPGRRLGTRAVNHMLDALGASVDVKVATHGLRHTAATTLLNKTNGNVRAVAEFLNHKNLNIVQEYDDERKQQSKKMGALLDDEPSDQEATDSQERET